MALTLKTGVYTPKKKDSAKNEEAFKEIAKAFKTLPMGEYVEVLNSEVKVSSVEAGIRDYVELQPGEYLKLSRQRAEIDGKSTIVAVRLIKTTPPQPKKVKTTDTQGTV